MSNWEVKPHSYMRNKSIIFGTNGREPVVIEVIERPEGNTMEIDIEVEENRGWEGCCHGEIFLNIPMTTVVEFMEKNGYTVTKK